MTDPPAWYPDRPGNHKLFDKKRKNEGKIVSESLLIKPDVFIISAYGYERCLRKIMNTFSVNNYEKCEKVFSL